MQPHSQRMDQMRKELQNPKKFQPNEKFSQATKFALNVCNKTYNKKYITLGDLPAVIDDQKIANQTIKMLGILPENTFELTDATSDELDEIIDWL